MKVSFFVKISALIIVVFLISAFVIIKYYENKERYFSIEPESWVVRQNNQVYVDIYEASYGHSRPGAGAIVTGVLDDKVYYRLFGYYNGEYFSEYGYDQSTPKIHIGYEMDSTDGVGDVYFSIRTVNGKSTTFIFVDDDFLEQMPKSNIVYGEDFLSERPSKFRELKYGIYMDSVPNYPLSKEGILAVGDVDKEAISKDDFWGKTFAVLR